MRDPLNVKRLRIESHKALRQLTTIQLRRIVRDKTRGRAGLAGKFLRQITYAILLQRRHA